MEQTQPVRCIDAGTGVTSFVFLGEAGCGKSEIALNQAAALAERGDRPVHFFDLDMTKPLFRSRDLAGELEARGITVHFEEQFMDAPTAGGGVETVLRRGDCCAVLDVGGDYIGARSVGRYAPLFRLPSAGVYYVINPYRPWSDTTGRIDAVLSDILAVTHLSLEELHLIANPNLGPDTAAEDVIAGWEMLMETVEPYRSLELCCVQRSAAARTAAAISRPVMELELFLRYPWLDGDRL